MTNFISFDNQSYMNASLEPPIPTKEKVLVGDNCCGTREVKEAASINIGEIIEFFPEVQKIASMTDAFFTEQHQDSRLKEASKCFTEILKGNPEVFKEHSLSEKAKILFELYKKVAVKHLMNFDWFKDNLAELKTKIGKASLVENEVVKVINKEITRLHRGFPAFAIAASLNMNVQSVELSDQLNPIESAALDHLALPDTILRFFKGE